MPTDERTLTATAGVKSQDAYYAYDSHAQIWEIGTDSVARRMRFETGKGFRLLSWRDKITNREWYADGGKEFSVTIDSATFDAAAPDLTLGSFDARVHANDSLELHIALARGAATIHLHYVAFPNTSVIEQWIGVENSSAETLKQLAAINSALALAPFPENLILYRVQGYEPQAGDTHDPARVSTYHLRAHEIAEGVTHTHFSTRRSSEENLGWFALNAAGLGKGPVLSEGEGLFGGMEWSGAWWWRVNRANGVTTLEALTEDFRRDLAPGETFETPRRFYGFYRGGVDDAASATHDFARRYLLRAHPDDFPWAHFNTWFTYYVNLNEEQLRRDVDLAAELGLEAFCVDAGWYEGSAFNCDFSFGLGTWRENREKFPSGLATFADYVHSKGLKFGLWVEPERLDLKYAGAGTPVPFEWFSPQTPFDAPPPPEYPQSARLCLGNRGAVDWCKDFLTRVVREYHVDWLKWDCNLFLWADPAGELRDGEYRHVQGYYDVLDHLRTEFPNLMIENCAAGGHRMDFGLLRRTDVTWLADDTEPSFRVRYYFHGASHAFPPEYLNAWIVESYFEHLADARDAGKLRAWLRSRMMGAFGLSLPLGALTAEQRAVIAAEIARYKSWRGIIRRGKMDRLTAQTDLLAPPNLQMPAEADALQFYDPVSKRGVVFLFQGTAAWENNRRVPLRGLDAATVYEIASADRALNERRTGEALMAEGIAWSWDAENPSVVVQVMGDM